MGDYIDLLLRSLFVCCYVLVKWFLQSSFLFVLAFKTPFGGFLFFPERILAFFSALYIQSTTLRLRKNKPGTAERRPRFNFSKVNIFGFRLPFRTCDIFSCLCYCSTTSYLCLFLRRPKICFQAPPTHFGFCPFFPCLSPHGVYHNPPYTLEALMRLKSVV